MKNMLRSTAAWLNEKVSPKRAPVPQLVPQVEVQPPAPVQPEVKASSPAVAPVLPMTPPTPVAPIEPTLNVDLPKLTIQIKGTHFYATCPHCESQFNLQQRLVDPRFKRLFATSGLTCPKCEKAVAMPTAEELRAKKN
jgi:hypothetical protein